MLCMYLYILTKVAWPRDQYLAHIYVYLNVFFFFYRDGASWYVDISILSVLPS